MWLSLFSAFVQAGPVISEAPDSQSIALYQQLAFVTETRTVDVPAGRSTIVFRGVSDQMVPQSATLLAFEGVTVERNFDAGLLSPGALFEANVGKEVVLARTNPTNGEVEVSPATVLNANGGLVVKTDEGVEALHCSGMPEGLSFDQRPTDLLAQPQLSIDVSASAAGPQTLTISYLASGFSWAADYVVALDEDGQTAHMTGWMTLENNTNSLIADAPAAVIAGQVQSFPETRAPDVAAKGHLTLCWPSDTSKTYRPEREPLVMAFNRGRMEKSAPAPVMAMMMESEMAMADMAVATEEEFGDYKLFRPPYNIDLAPYQTKQIAFLDQADVAVRKVYAFTLSPPYPGQIRQQANLRVDIDNSKEGTLARSLPRGTVRVFSPSAVGTRMFFGEGGVRDLAVDLPAEVAIRRSGAVQMELTVTPLSGRGPRGDAERMKMEAMLINATDAPVVAEVQIPGWLLGNAGRELVAESQAQLADKPFPTWEVTIPAQGTQTLTLEVLTDR